MVKWDDGTHAIAVYNDDNGYGLTLCGARIGPWDVWLVGRVKCRKCRAKGRRIEAEGKHRRKGPKEWFPKEN